MLRPPQDTGGGGSHRVLIGCLQTSQPHSEKSFNQSPPPMTTGSRLPGWFVCLICFFGDNIQVVLQVKGQGHEKVKTPIFGPVSGTCWGPSNSLNQQPVQFTSRPPGGGKTNYFCTK